MSWSPSSCILLISVYLQPVCDHGSLLFPFSCWLKQLLIFAITPFPRSTKITSQLTRRFLLNLFHSISPMSVKFPKPVFLIMRSRKINAFSDFKYQHFSCSLFLELPYWPRFFPKLFQTSVCETHLFDLSYFFICKEIVHPTVM